MRGYFIKRASICSYKPYKALVCVFIIALLPFAEARLGPNPLHSRINLTNDDSSLLEDRATTTLASASTRVVHSDTENKIKEETEKLAIRLADLFTCVPGKVDSKVSTQSWYIMNTFMAWNNDLARSTLSKDVTFSEENKKLFIQTALERLKDRRDGFEKDEKIKSYISSLAQTTEILFKNALNEKRVVYDKSTDLSELLIKSHASGEENVFKKLASAHDEHVGFLAKHDCTGLKPGFWQTPSYGFPSTTSSTEKVTKAKVEHKKTTQRDDSSTEESSEKKPARKVAGSAGVKVPSGSAGVKVAPGTSHGVSEKPPVIRDYANQQAYFAQIDRQYPYSRKITGKLPYMSEDKRKATGEAGYITYRRDSRLYGRPYVIGNILKADYILSRKGISLGIGDINTKPTNIYHTETGGHSSHDEGRALDLYLVKKNGVADWECTIHDSCYDRQKTFEMCKAMIDVDPDNFLLLYIGDPKLRGMLQSYLKQSYGYSSSRANSAITNWPGHDNHVHFHWRP